MVWQNSQSMILSIIIRVFIVYKDNLGNTKTIRTKDESMQKYILLLFCELWGSNLVFLHFYKFMFSKFSMMSALAIYIQNKVNKHKQNKICINVPA